LRSEFCKVLEHIPSEQRLLVRAGVGWDPGIVGVASIGDDLSSPAGFALHTGKPVISNHLEHEERFRTPELLRRHGIVRAMNVILQGDGRPFGVLEVDSRDEDTFQEQDLAFLQGAANILGMAIERDRYVRNLDAALERQQFLLTEMNHRVKNSLSIVASMLRLQATAADDPALTRHLEDASHRVLAVARAHDQLSHSANIERMDIGKYIEGVCKDLNASVPHCEIRADVEYGIEVSTDRAISAALIVNELVSNAVKYGYPGDQGGRIWVALAHADDTRFSISVRDEGLGTPEGFDYRQSKGLGMRIISSFSKQLGGDLVFRPGSPGAEFIVTIPHTAPG
jgi:two-component sensor histidine kinase